MQLMNYTNPVLQLGIPDEFVEHGDPKVLLSQIGLDKAGILNSLTQKGWI